jgi:hypothetical protein
MSVCDDVLSRVKIRDVYRALGGPDPRRTGRDTWRAPAFWRSGDGFNVSGDDARGIFHDFVDDSGGGILDLVVRVRGGNRADALRWLADFAGVPFEDTPLAADDRERRAQERRELERALPDARHWRRAAVWMAESLLENLKAALFDANRPQPDTGEIAHVESMLASLRRKEGGELLAEFNWWLQHHPGLTASLVRSAKQRDAAERRALAAYLRGAAA